MKNNNQTSLSPLEELRQRKAVLQQECRVDEDRFFKTVENIRGNWKSILISSLFSSSKSLSGAFFSSLRGGRDSGSANSGMLHKMLPLAWTILQPILMKMAMNKLKSFFTRKKK